MEVFSFRYKLLLFFIVFLGVGFLTADAATLSLSPSSTSTTVGNIFSVNILLDTQGTSTNGVDIYYLNFSTSLLEVQDDGGAAGIQIAAGTLMPQTITNTANNSLGRIEFSQLGSYGAGYNGSSTLATVRFLAKAAGTANVTFNFTSDATTDTNVDAGGIDILTSVTNGSYIISNPITDTTPPVRSNGSPNIQLAAGITQATLSLTTNENATCRYSLTAGTVYSAMTNTFSTTGATNHSTNVSSLQNGQSYTYYVRCQDFASPSNANTDDNFYISFSVASGGGGGDTTAPTIPGNFTASAISASQINLSWTASTDTGGSGLAGYRIYRCTGSSCSPAEPYISTSPTNSYSNTNLNQSTVYVYAVAAYDAAGNASSQSATSTATTLSLDTTPPVRANGLPSGELPSGTTSATLSLTTDDSATCRYSLTAGVTYGTMTDVISMTATTTHSTTISNLSNSNSYTYYVVCQNTDGYPNTTDYPISFSIATAPPSGNGTPPPPSPGPIIVPPSGSGPTVFNPPPGNTLTPVQIRNLVIRKPNGILVAEKDIVDISILNFEAQIFDSNNQKVRLEVELKKFDEQFTNAPTLFSEYVDSGKIAIITRGGLVNGSYRLRARARRYPDPNIVGAEVVSEWLWFGDQNTRDFTILASQQPIQIPVVSGFQYYFSSNMSLKMKNKDVEALQKILNLERVYPENIISGYFGNLTKKAVIAFQEKYNISPAIGFVGPLTRIKLNALYAPKEGAAPVVAPLVSGELVGPFSIGMRSEQVKVLQSILAKDSTIYPERKITGYYGKLTVEAVKRFQMKYNITPASGVAGPKTRVKLNELYGK